MVDKVSFSRCYPAEGYQYGQGVWNWLDVCDYYLSEYATRDWGNSIIPLSINAASLPAAYGCHSWTGGQAMQEAHDLAMTQSLSMQMLYDWYGHPILPNHPVLSNQELTNVLGPSLSLNIDPTQGMPYRQPDGVWYKLLNKGNIWEWDLVYQDDPNLQHEGYPPQNPRLPPETRSPRNPRRP